MWGNAADKLRVLVPKALDVLAAELEHGEDKAATAMAVLKLAGGAITVVPNDPTDADAYIRKAAEEEREARSREREGELDDLIAGQFGSETPLQTVHKRLAALAGEPADTNLTTEEPTGRERRPPQE